MVLFKSIYLSRKLTLFSITILLLSIANSNSSQGMIWPTKNNEIKNVLEQAFHLKYLQAVRDLLNLKLPAGCSQISKASIVREAGQGENYTGESIRHALSIHGNPIEFLIPTINFDDNPSSRIFLPIGEFKIQGKNVFPIKLVRYYYQNTPTATTLERWNRALWFQNDLLSAVTRTEEIQIYYGRDQNQHVKRIEYVVYDRNPTRLNRTLNCGEPLD